MHGPRGAERGALAFWRERKKVVSATRSPIFAAWALTVRSCMPPARARASLDVARRARPARDSGTARMPPKTILSRAGVTFANSRAGGGSGGLCRQAGGEARGAGACGVPQLRPQKRRTRRGSGPTSAGLAGSHTVVVSNSLTLLWAEGLRTDSAPEVLQRKECHSLFSEPLFAHGACQTARVAPHSCRTTLK